MFTIEQTRRFLAMWAVSGTKGQMPSHVSSHSSEFSSSMPPELAFWIWLLGSLAVLFFVLRAMYSNLDGAFLFLPSRGTPPPQKRTCACGYVPDSDEDDCPTCGEKLPLRVAEHLQKYRGPGRRSRSVK